MHLTLEPIAEALGGDLDGHLAPHARIAGAVDFAHSAGAEGHQDFVGAETSSGSE
jgi:hypothetical protein